MFIINLLERIWPFISAIAVGAFAVIRLWLAHRAKSEAVAELKIEVDKEIREHLKEINGVVDSPVHGPHIISSAVDTQKVYNVLNYIVSNTDAVRAIIFKAHNGGKIPNLNEKMYFSVMHEVYAKGNEPAAKKFQAQEVDQCYYNLLVELIQNKKISKSTSELMPGSLLQDHYLVAGVSYSKFYEIYYNQKTYVYLSVNFKKSEDFTSRERDVIRTSAMEIRNIYKNEFKQ